MYNKLLVFLSIIIIIIVLIILYYKNKKYDTFAIPKTPKEINDNDGNMTFEFLNNENTNYVLDKYYINDDTKINGVRVNYHPYQEHVNNPVIVDAYSKYLQNSAYPYIYGNPKLHIQRTPGQWNKYDTKAQDIYNQYGIRR